ncbi:uncharacterized protein LOC128602260 [Ictalurus furcatus]|uniref:uncharacterized protein LOC128602260 n=1 Tax=Ictalurus furcatus TaxID=66913 RepID=UPI002350FE44|nr:uncharacterized protein LOC128602260 [Ictalurus furcatus]
MLVRRKSAWSVEMLAVLVVLVTLVPTWSDGLLLTKCELKSQLEAAFSKLQVENAADIIAKLACTVENISGFNTSLVNNIDQFDPGTLIIAPFVCFNDEDYPAEMGELPLTTNTVSNDYVFPESTEGTEEPSTPLQVVGEDKFTPGQDGESVDVDAQARKQREAPSEDEGDGSGAGLIDDGDILHATVESHRLPDPTDVDNEIYKMLFGPTDLPPDSTAEPNDIPYDDYEMIFGPTDLPPDSTAEPNDIPYDDYEMLFGPKSLPPDSTAEPKDIPYDDYEMIFGPKGLPPDSTAEPKDIPYDDYEMIFGPKGLPPDSTAEPKDIPYDDYEMIFGPKGLPPDSTAEPKDIPYDDYEMIFGPKGLPPDSTAEPKDIPYDDYEMIFGPTDLPPDSTAEPNDIPYDDYEMLFGPKSLPPDSTAEPKDIPYDDYEMLFGPKGLPPDSTAEPKDIPYDDYEMLFGPKGLPPDSTAEPKDPLDIPLNTIGPLEPETKKRSKRSSEDQTLLYGIFQLSDITCNSGLSYSLDLCQLSCSALTDDDITDDIACLMGLDEKMVRMTFLQECLSVEPSDYFAECG